MEKSPKKWAKDASVLPPAKRSAKLEHNPVTTCITLTSFGVPTHAIRRVYQGKTRNRYLADRTGH